MRLYVKAAHSLKRLGEVTIDEGLLGDASAALALVTYLISLSPGLGRARGLALEGESVALRVGSRTLRAVAQGPASKLYELRKLLALTPEAKLIPSSEIFSLEGGTFMTDPLGTLSELSREVRAAVRGKARKALLRAVRDAAKSLKAAVRGASLSESWEGARENEGGELPEPLEEYSLGPFRVAVVEREGCEELEYRVSYASDHFMVRLGSVFVSRVLRETADVTVEGRLALNSLLRYRRRRAATVMSRSLQEVPRELVRHVCAVASYRSLGLLKLAPFLLDDDICEFYVDAPGTLVYLDHYRFGRCVSNVRVSAWDVDSFITHVKLESGLPLDPENPSLKADLKVGRFRLRVSVDVPPLAVDGAALDVRKFREEPMTLPELIRLGALTADVAALILLYATHRANIAIVGEPGSGKTTLLNAIDLCLPNHLRRIYVEDVVESARLHALGKHQLRLRVEPLEVADRARLKKHEVLKLLHRKPDYVILGELQSRDHFEAALSAMVSGLRCLQTCHAPTLEQFVRRLTCDYGFRPELVFGTYDLVVVMRRYVSVREFRRVVQVAEMLPAGSELVLYSYPGRPDVSRLESSEFLKHVCEEEGLTMGDLIRECEVYGRALEFMAERSIVRAADVVSLFEKVVRRRVRGEGAGGVPRWAAQRMA